MDESQSVAAASNVDDWLARFSLVADPSAGVFPFKSHRIQSIESRRARMSDLLIFDVLLIRGGIRNPDALFPPTDWSSLRKLLDAIDQSVYDILKKDCLVYILLRWAWDMDLHEANPGWDARYLQDRCIAPQFVALADAYWLLDTGNHLAKAVSILSDARLNRDFVSKILQALALSSSPASFASGTAHSTATLVVNYVRTAKPLLTEPDDIELYTLSLAQLSFMDAWAYQKSFPEGSDTRERLLSKIVCWCFMPTPKQGPLAQLLAFQLSSYEHSFLNSLALPSQFSTPSASSSVKIHPIANPSGSVLSSQAVATLQELLCVRAIQSGDYVYAIKLDRQFSSVSTSLGNATSSSSIVSQATSSGRDMIDRRTIIQDLFSTLPPAERTLLEDEIGKVATGVRATFTPKQGASGPAKRAPMAESNFTASWEDISSSAISPTPVPISTTSKVNQSSLLISPFTSHIPRPQPTSGYHAPPTPNFTAFGSPMRSTASVNMGRGVTIERGKNLFSTSAAGEPSAAVRSTAYVSLFDTAGSAKNAPNAFYKPPSAPVATALHNIGSALASSSTMTKQNGKAQGGENDDDDDMSIGSKSEAKIVEEDHGNASGEEIATDEEQNETGNFITHDKTSAVDVTLHSFDVDEMMDENGEPGFGLGFSVFSGSKNALPTGSLDERGKKATNGNGEVPHTSSPPSARVSSREGNKSPSLGTNSARRLTLPGAFHHEDEDEDDDRQDENKEEGEGEEHDRSALLDSPRRSSRPRMQVQTPSRPSARSQRTSRNITTGDTSRPSTRTRKSSSARPSFDQTIPGSLMTEDDDGQDDADRSDTHADEGTEFDELQEEDDAIAPLPSRTSRRTRSSGYFGAPTTTTTKSKSSAKSTAAAKTKTKARPSEVKTPARRSSRLSTASSVSPEHVEIASPTKQGRKSTGSRGSVGGSGSGTVATRSSTRRKR